MINVKPLTFFLIIFLVPTVAFAEIITGNVVRIIDGDTLVVLINGRLTEKIRLTEIDAPERNQAFGNRSRQSLAALCFHKQATLNVKARDHYRRLLARVYCNGIDVNAEQVRTGMAWVYARYTKDKTLYNLQEQAKQSKLGLWADPYAFPPWLFRRR